MSVRVPSDQAGILQISNPADSGILPPMIDRSPQHASADARRAVALLLLINLFNYIDRYVLAAVEPLIQADFFPKAAPTTAPPP